MNPFLAPLKLWVEQYLIWIKLTVAIALLLGSFSAGVRWESRAQSALQLKQERIARDWERKATENAATALNLQITKQAEMEKARLAWQKKAEQQRAAALRSANEYWKNNPQANVPVHAGVVRLWRGTNEEPGAVATADSTTTAGTPDAGDTRCAVADLHANHADLVARYKAMSMDLADLQQWARDAVVLCNAK